MRWRTWRGRRGTAWSGVLAHEELQQAPRSADAIRADLERARAELALSLQDLRVEVARAVSFREWYRRHTGLFLIGAFALGVAIATRKRS